MRFSDEAGSGVRKMGQDLSISESFALRSRSSASLQFWIPGTISMKTQDRPTRSGLRLSVTGCAMLALLAGCAQQLEQQSQARMDERFAQLMRNDAGTSGQPTALAPGGAGPSSTA